MAEANRQIEEREEALHRREQNPAAQEATAEPTQKPEDYKEDHGTSMDPNRLPVRRTHQEGKVQARLPPVQHPATPDFFGIPQKIRNKIYALVLSGNSSEQMISEIDPAQNNGSPSYWENIDTPGDESDGRLLQVHPRVIREGAREQLWADNVFIFHDHLDPMAGTLDEGAGIASRFISRYAGHSHTIRTMQIDLTIHDPSVVPSPNHNQTLFDQLAHFPSLDHLSINVIYMGNASVEGIRAAAMRFYDYARNWLEAVGQREQRAAALDLLTLGAFDSPPGDLRRRPVVAQSQDDLDGHLVAQNVGTPATIFLAGLRYELERRTPTLGPQPPTPPTPPGPS